MSIDTALTKCEQHVELSQPDETTRNVTMRPMSDAVSVAMDLFVQKSIMSAGLAGVSDDMSDSLKDRIIDRATMLAAQHSHWRSGVNVDMFKTVPNIVRLYHSCIGESQIPYSVLLSLVLYDADNLKKLSAAFTLITRAQKKAVPAEQTSI